MGNCLLSVLVLRDFWDPDFSFISFEHSLACSLKADSISCSYIVAVVGRGTNSRNKNRNPNLEVLNLNSGGI